MQHSSARYPRTAKGVLSSLGLAVLFLFVPAFIHIWNPSPAWAVGIDIRLDENERHLVRFGYPVRKVGLSISSDSIPLLETNLRYAQSVLVNYEDGFVAISEKHGQYELYKPIFLTFPSYTTTSSQLQFQQGWRANLNRHFYAAGASSKGLFEWEIPVKFPKMVSAIIGEGGPGLKVTGYRRISFSGRSVWEEGLKNTATTRQSKFPSLHMEQQSAFKITGTIGSKISVQVDQDSRRQTDLQNTLQLRYKGEEDEIIQTIEAGNTNLNIGSGVVATSERKQGLFGIKTTAKIGGWNLTMITSQDKGSTQKADFKAGAETQGRYIRDYDYLKRVFYDLGYADDLSPADSIVEIKLFKSNFQINSNTAEDPAPFGIAYIDPEDTTKSGYEGPFLRRFKEIELDDYFVQSNNHYVQFFSPLSESDILAAYYVVWNKDNQSYDTTGFLKDSCTSAEQETCMVLKLLKSDNPKPDDYTWEYEWKNVYSLGARNIQREGFRLDIYKGPMMGENPETDSKYQDSTSLLRVFGLDQLNLNADSIPDGIVDYRQIDFGLGYLVFPRRYPFAPDPNVSFTGNPADTLKEKIDKIYFWERQDDPKNNSQYYIWVESAFRKSQYSLGHAPIIEGSDVVTLNGQPLIRGQDYTINYEIGEVSFLNSEALSPNAELSLSYEYAPLFMVEKKSMFGAMAEYNLGDKLKFGTVGIYKSQKSSDERPRIGQEPQKNFIWGSNLNFTSNAGFLTSMLNGIPWMRTNAQSSVTFRGEFAQSIPNPNTRDKAYIDDFEGSLEYTDLSIRRGNWTLSSPPQDKEIEDRCQMWWFNPYDQVLVSDIWPNKETERNQERTNILRLQFFPGKPHRPSNQQFDSSSTEQNWNGIMRSLYSGAYDQSRTMFLELWTQGEKGVLHVDLGEISEDLNGNRVRDTEDKPRNGQRDGILDDDEDLGLDTLNNEQEREFYDCQSCQDAAGDDWNYDNRYDYSRINGTQGNREDPDRGRRPDTEDINYNSVLDLNNHYFEFSIDLSQDDFLATKNEKGWKLYRIPITDPLNYDKIGEPEWNNIRFARLWVSSDEDCAIQIASLQLVGNRWQNLGVSSMTNRRTPLPIGTIPDEEFNVYVKNTHEDPDYYPPPGIAGILNRQTNVREKEQSLVLKFTSLKPDHQGVVYRILPNTEDYTSYQNLEMFVHGPEDSLQVNMEFYLQLGTDSTNIYEYRTAVYPGWDERNKIKIEFDQITSLKAYAANDSTNFINGRLDVSEGPYRVRGNPSLNKVRWFSMGVINADGQPASGEIWVDEMQVTGIRKEKGIAGSLDLTARLADVASVNMHFKKQDSEFRSIDQVKESKTSETLTNYRLSLTNVQIHRFLPVSFGYSLPLSYSYTRTLNLPKWKSGSDIVLPRDLREQEKKESVVQSIGFTPQFTHQTQNWLVGGTLKRMSHSLNYSTTRSRSLQYPVKNSSSSTITGGYSFPFGKGLNVKPFGWLKGALIPSSFTQMSFSLLPTSLSVSGSLNRARSHTEDRVGQIYDTYTRTFGGNLNASASPIKSIPLTYTMRTARDLADPQTIKYSLNPKNAKLGIETSYGETFSARYTPPWLSFMNASFSFGSKYNENADKLDQYNVGGTRKVTNSNETSAGFTLDWKKFLGQPTPQGEEKKPSLFSPLNLLRALTNRIDPINVTWRKNQVFNRSGLLARPSLKYRLGFSDVLGVKRVGLAQSTDRETISEAYSGKSGVNLLATHFDLSYAKNTSQTKTASDHMKNTSTRFPDFGFNLNKLANLGIVKKIFTSFTYKTGYFKQLDEQGNLRTGEKIYRKTSENFFPLASISLTWKNGVRTTIKLDKKTLTDENLKISAGNQSVTKTYDNSINVTNNYSFSAPGGIKFPFLRKLKFKSTLNLSVSISKSSKKTESSVGGKPFNITADSDRLSISCSGSYTFSSQVTGGFKTGWGDTNDKKTRRKTHIRELGIWIQINF